MAKYYIDTMGDDRNDGLSPETAWKSLEKASATVFAPGDALLLKAGCVFEGQLWPKGSGTAAAPITVDSYGGGDKPVVDAGGTHGTKAGNYLDGAAFVLYNQDYWDVSNLDVTNFNPYYRQQFIYFTPEGERNVPVPSPENRYRYGMLIRWDNYGVGRHVHVSDCDIHDVNGEMQRFCAEGILIAATGTPDGVPTSFDDVRVERCSICDIDRTALSVFSQWTGGRGTEWRGNLETTSNFYHVTIGDWVGSTNVVIAHNYISECAGDAILIGTTDGALIEHNYVEHSCREMRIGANAGVWPINADNTVMQYNEVCYTHGVMDGQAFDIDLTCRNTLVQYNHTHHNEGGFMLIMGGTEGNVIRCNHSEDDYNGLFWIHESKSTVIEDNIFDLTTEKMQVFRSPYDDRNMVMRRNTFTFREPWEVRWNPSITYEGNTYVGAASLPEDRDAVVK